MNASVRSIDIARARARKRWGIPVVIPEQTGSARYGRPTYIKRVGRLLSVEQGTSEVILYEILINGDLSSYFYLWDEFEFLGRTTGKVIPF